MRSGASCLAAGLAICIAAPAAAETGSFYVGLEAGPTAGRNNDVDEVVGSIAAPMEYDDVLSIGYRTGHDLGIAGGHDLGLFRVELEVAHKQADLKSVKLDENFPNFIAAVPALAGSEFNLPGKVSTISAMANGLVDIGVTKRLSLYGGGGYGRAWVRAIGDQDSAWGWQWIAGVRFAISEKFEIGLKQRYFNSGILKLQHGPIAYPDPPPNAIISPEIEGEYRTRSLLVSLHANL